jgi:hypothetical protein
MQHCSNPTTGIACCCARTASGHATAAPAEKRDEFAPPQLIGPHVPPRFEDRTASYPKWRIAVRGSVTYFAVHQVLRFE